MYVQVRKNRYATAWAVLDDDCLIDAAVFDAPDDDLPSSLDELYGRIVDRIKAHKPNSVAVWEKGSAGRGAPAWLSVARNVEGVLYAAAGSQRCEVAIYRDGKSVRAALGLQGMTRNDEIVAAARKLWTGDTDDDRIAYAAAAALAALQSA
jgi:Holliday junction resolvasome RuvABC endonuclease subunit